MKNEREKIKSIINQVVAMGELGNNEGILNQLVDLKQDILGDRYMAVVMGEFKRGKSTFINSLLGGSLLPMDVLPETATINVLKYNEEPVVNVYYHDGRVEQGVPEYDYLKKFSATKSGNCASEVKLIEIGYPVELLANNVMLVDTPGVSDINDQRCEVTYGFVPKANIVIFLLDAVSPLKATEYEFIEEKLFPLGVNNIIFVANRYDFVDEEEDEEFLSDLQIRLENAFHVGEEGSPIKEIILFPLSAKMALEAVSDGNERLLEASGLPALQEKLLAMLSGSSIEDEKNRAFKKRLIYILRLYISLLEDEKQMKVTDIDTLRQIESNLEALIHRSENDKCSIPRYVEKNQHEIFSMVDKSVSFFNQRLQEDVLGMIADYQATDLKGFVERTVARRVKNNFESWLATYSPCVDQLLKKLEMELARGMSYYFKQSIVLESNVGRDIQSNGFNIAIDVEDISNVTYHAGAVAAVGSIGLMAITGGALLPLIGFAALPILKDNMLKKRLAMAKAEIEPEIMSQIAAFSLKMQSEIHSYVREHCDVVIKNTEFAYDKILSEYKKKISEQIKVKESQSENLEKEVEQLESRIGLLSGFVSELQN